MSKLRRVDDERDVEEPLLGESLDGKWTRPLSASASQTKRRLQRVALVAGGILGVVVVALLVVQSQMHRIASNAIASTTMAIGRMELTQPQQDALTLSVELHVDSPSLFTAHLASTNFTIMYQTMAVGVFEAPAMEVHQGHNTQLFTNTTLRISNHSAWDLFARDLMLSESLAYEIQGDVAISVSLLGGLIRLSANGIALQKTMTSHGMDGLKRMEIADLVMTDSTETQVLARIKTCLYNPSTVSIQPVGRICMEGHYPTLSDTSHVAHLVTPQSTSISITRDDPSHPYCAGLPNKNLTHGYNLLELQGEMLGTNQDAISALISKFLSNQPAALTVVACSPRASSVDIFNEAMKGLRIPAVLPPQKDPLIGRLFFQGITLDTPELGHENEYIGLRTDVTVEASSPLGPHSALQLQSIEMHVGLYAQLRAGKDDELLGDLVSRRVEILDGRLVQVSNISVRCDAHLQLEHEGRAFGAFVRASVKNETVQLRLQGSMDVVAQGALGRLHLKGLPLDVVSQMLGMGNFERVTIDEFALPGRAAKPHGEELTTKISLWNPSLFAVSIGIVQLEMTLASTGDHLGALSGLMDLKTGGNALHLQGRIEPKLDTTGTVSLGVASFFSAYLRGESSRVGVTVVGVQFPKCNWLRDALMGLRIGTSFPGVQPGFQLITGLEMRQLDVEMMRAEAAPALGSNTRMRVRTDLTATLKMPPAIAIPINISTVAVALTLQDAQRRAIGKLTSDREACEFRQQPSGFFRLNMAHSYPVRLLSGASAAGMAAFITELLTASGNVTMRITADASDDEGAFPDVATRMGLLRLMRVPIAGDPEIPAMNAFREPPVQILSIDIARGSKDDMAMDMAFAIVNPSVVKTALGSLVLDVYASLEGDLVRMGEASIANFELACCGATTTLRGRFVFHPAQADRGRAMQFLSNFVSGYFTDGKPQKILIGGSKQSTPLDILQPALTALRIPSLLPTLADLFPATPSLVTSSVLYTPSILHLTQIPTALKLQNPFSESITVTRVDLELYPCEKQRNVNGSLVCEAYYSDPLARFAPDDFAPIFIPAKSNGCYSCCQGAHCEQKMPLCPRAAVGQCMAASVQGFLSAEAIAALFHTATTGLLMKVNGTIGAAIGEYETQLLYRQEALRVTLA